MQFQVADFILFEFSAPAHYSHIQFDLQYILT